MDADRHEQMIVRCIKKHVLSLHREVDKEIKINFIQINKIKF